MPNSVTVKLSISKDFAPHTKLIVDDTTMEILSKALLAYTDDSNRYRLANMYEEIRTARQALALINPK